MDCLVSAWLTVNSRNMMDSTVVIRQSQLVTVVELVSALKALE